MLKKKQDLEKIMKEVIKDKEVIKEENKEGEKKMQSTITTTIYGALDNRSTGSCPMSFLDRHEWVGSVPDHDPYPSVLEKDRLKMFVLPGPSKGGVAYLQNDRRWLLAWDSRNNKIYVECGSHKGAVDWNGVQVKLDGSRNTSVCWDKITDAKAMGLVEACSSIVSVISAFL